MGMTIKFYGPLVQLLVLPVLGNENRDAIKIWGHMHFIPLQASFSTFSPRLYDVNLHNSKN